MKGLFCSVSHNLWISTTLFSVDSYSNFKGFFLFENVIGLPNSTHASVNTSCLHLVQCGSGYGMHLLIGWPTSFGVELSLSGREECSRSAFLPLGCYGDLSHTTCRLACLSWLGSANGNNSRNQVFWCWWVYFYLLHRKTLFVLMVLSSVLKFYL